MKLIDSNALVVLLIGLIDPKLLTNHKRTSIYTEEDYYNLLNTIQSFDKLIVLPNVWTEVDNLLNNFGGKYKYSYILNLKLLIQNTTEKFLETLKATESIGFYELGITDSLLLEYAKECELLITADSALADYANAMKVKVYDMKKLRNDRLKR